MTASKKQPPEAEAMKEGEEALTEGTNETQAREVAVLILKGPATLVSGGIKFVKGIPQQIDDRELARRLMASGLFEAGDKQ